MKQHSFPRNLLGLDREQLGQLVRRVWISWAKEQPDAKLSWLVEWDGLSERDREVDRRIGEQIAQYVDSQMSACSTNANEQEIVTCAGCGKEHSKGEMILIHFCSDCNAIATRLAQSEGPVVVHDAEELAPDAQPFLGQRCHVEGSGFGTIVMLKFGKGGKVSGRVKLDDGTFKLLVVSKLELLASTV